MVINQLKFFKNFQGIDVDIFLQSVGALNDPTRIMILEFIRQNEEVCVCQIERAFEMIQSRVSRHLKILKDAGFLRVERRGTWAYYAIRSPLDRVRLECLEEIRTLCLEIPLLPPSQDTIQCS